MTRARARGPLPRAWWALWALVACAPLVAGPRVSHAQFVNRPELEWRTLETARFAFHYPAPLERWTRATAARIESIDSAVARIVGFAPRKRIDVVVEDPYGIPNGSAWPFLDRPSLILWASPPTPDDDIGDFHDWAELLAIHEMAHLAHLNRPSRNPLVELLWRALPVQLGPVAQKAPRWLFEGYATYVEGRLSGSGRPNGSWRAAILRQLALEGRLPTYAQLNGSGSWLGGSYAYLVGSAYIDWLAARADGDSSLVHLWRRMSARQNRGFVEAFTGVFGESPDRLYGRFTAELTRSAYGPDDLARLPRLDSGTVVQRLSRGTGDPAISTDGGRVALVLRSATLPPRTVILKTIDEPDTTRARRARELLRRDPEDVPARSIYPPAKKPIATLLGVGNLAYESPRFFRDGRVLVWRRTARPDGSYRPELFVWDPTRRTVRRVTDAAVRDGDPSPDGQWAAAVQCTRGWCDLVRVSLDDGRVTVLAEGNPSMTYDRPRVSPDGESIVAALHTGGRWRIAMLPAAGGTPRLVDSTGDNANSYDPSFAGDGRLLVVTDRSGQPLVALLDTAGGVPSPLVSASGAAIAPELNPADSTAWFLSLHAEGWDLRRSMPITRQVNRAGSPLAATFPAAPPQGPTIGTSLPLSPLGTDRPYGIGPRHWTWIPFVQAGADGIGGALALVNSDVVGRGELLVQGAWGNRASWRGASLDFTWRGSRPRAALQLHHAARAPSRAGIPAVNDDSLDDGLTGAVLSLDVARAGDRLGARGRAGLSLGHIDPASGPDRGRALGFAEGTLRATAFGDGRRASIQLRAHGTAGRTGGDAVVRTVGGAALDLGGPRLLPFQAAVIAGHVRGDDPFERFTLGGMPSAFVHPSILTQHVAIPAVPSGIDRGESMLLYRIAVPLRLVTPYYLAARTRDDGSWRPWHRVRGVEWSGTFPYYPAVGTPAARVAIGIAQSMDAPFARETRGYVTVLLGDAWR